MQAIETWTNEKNLARIASALKKGGIPKDISAKIIRGLSRKTKGEITPERTSEIFENIWSGGDAPARNLSEDIRDWVDGCDSGVTWSVTECDRDLVIVTNRDRQVRRKVFKQLRDGQVIRQERSGRYCRIDTELEAIDMDNVELSDKYVNFKWPFYIEQQCTLHPGNLAVVAGAANAGKTALLLNLCEYNMRHYDIHYVSSEMGAEELYLRLSQFQTPLNDFKEHVHWWEKSGDFQDVVRRDSGAVWIIDYLELSDDFYKVGGILRQIHDNLTDGLAIIALQKDRGKDVGRGGDFTLEKPRLYLAMNHGELKIVKAKNWGPKARAEQANPNGKIYTFKLVNGCKFMER